MSSQSNVRKILEQLNNTHNLDSYTKMLDFFDQLVDLPDDDEDVFLIPQEGNLQLPEIFLRDTFSVEHQEFLNKNTKLKKEDDFEQICFDVLEYLETVELEEYEPINKAPEIPIDSELLKKMVDKYF
ncbi:hypothetical protein M153_3162000456 [Pseudoloma neurophilia]|uniref:Uncharacterized protein n=1 Tax=Pseudoloma neurophilia TaxID=146866 RepID=A0A0R0LZD1_9MICR|nr:hypothetical protein M153_3162000456 [Pseudoloma neurophilia]